MSTQTMKAVRLHEFGGPEVLRYEDAPRPQLASGEVLWCALRRPGSTRPIGIFATA